MAGTERIPIEDATAYIREHRDLYTDEALRERLRQIGYQDDVIEEAFREAERPAVPPVKTGPSASPYRDRRPTAATIAIAGSIGGWLLIWAAGAIRQSGYEPGMDWTWSGAGIMVQIAALVLLAIMVLSLVGVVRSGRLRAGEPGAIVAILALPAILVLGVVGTCLVLFTWA